MVSQILRIPRKSRFGFTSPFQHAHLYFIRGNNVVTYVGPVTNTTSQSSPTLNFIYVQDPTQEPNLLEANIDAARVNTFYIVNTVHDISYLYGFTEAAYNFQNDNFGKGGSGNDRIQVSVQDPSDINNGKELITKLDDNHGLIC